MSDGIVRALGRDWTADDRVDLALMLDDPTFTVKEINARFGVGGRSLRPDVRAKLGVGQKRRAHGGNNQRGRLPIPEHAHPLVRATYRLINKERTTQKDIALRAGLGRTTVHLWQRQNPRIDSMEAVLNALGYKLQIVPMSNAEERAADRKKDAT